MSKHKQQAGHGRPEPQPVGSAADSVAGSASGGGSSDGQTAPEQPTGGTGRDPHAIVRSKNVKKIYVMGTEKVEALRGVSLEIFQGEYISIMGPSGSGKSTFFNMIGGLDKPSEGQVFIDEVDIAQLDAYELAWLRCRKIGYIFQTFNLIPVMSALENVTLPMVFAGMTSDEARDKGAALLDKVGLGTRLHHRPFELSGGQQQRVAIARALVMNPSLLLMDEPFAALDAQTRTLMHEQLQELWLQTRKSILFVTHSVGEAVRLADRIIVLSAHPGRIRREIRVDLAHPRRFDSPDISELARQVRKEIEDEVNRVNAQATVDFWKPEPPADMGGPAGLLGDGI